MTIGEDYTPPGRGDSGQRGQGNQGQGNQGQGNQGQGNQGQGQHGNHGQHGDGGPRDDQGKHADHAVKVNWDAYDVPRIWQMVAQEGNNEAQDLVWAFSKISQYVDDTRLRLVEAAKRLALAWSGAAAADSAQGLIVELTEAMTKDTTAYVTATRELDNVVTRLGETKVRVEPLYQQFMRLATVSREAGMFSSVVSESDVFQTEVEHTNAAAREEMRKLDRDLTGARITTTEEFIPSTGVPSTGDLQLAGLGPQAIEAAHGGGGGGLGRGLLPAGGSLPPSAPLGTGGASGLGSGIAAAGRPSMGGVIGGDSSAANRPMGGGMMGGAHGGAHGGADAGGGGRADTQWTTRQGVSPVIDGTPPPKPSTMGVDDGFENQQKRK